MEQFCLEEYDDASDSFKVVSDTDEKVVMSKTEWEEMLKSETSIDELNKIRGDVLEGKYIVLNDCEDTSECSDIGALVNSYREYTLPELSDDEIYEFQKAVQEEEREFILKPKHHR